VTQCTRMTEAVLPPSCMVYPWIARFTPNEHEAARRIVRLGNRPPLESLRTFLPAVDTAPGSTGSPAGDDEQARRLCEGLLYGIENLDTLGTTIDEMLAASGDVLLPRDVAWIAVYHSSLALLPLVFRKRGRLEPGHFPRVYSLGMVHVAGVRPNVLRAAGYNPAALSMGAYMMATSFFLPDRDAVLLPVGMEESYRALHHPATRQAYIARVDLEDWVNTEREAAHRRPEGGALLERLDAVKQWDSKFGMQFAMSAFEPINLTQKALDRASRSRGHGGVSLDDARAYLQDLWVVLGEQPWRSPDVWIVGRDGRFHANARAMLDLLGKHSKSPRPMTRESELPVPEDESSPFDVYETPDSGRNEPERREILAIIEAAALDELDRADLHLAFAGEFSRRARARSLSVDEKTLRNRNRALVDRLQGPHPNIAAVAARILGARADRAA